MSRIYKYNHRQKTVQSLIFILPAVLVWVSAILWKFLSLSLAQKYLTLNLSFPELVQFLLWVVLPIWALISAAQGYKSGTIKRYKPWNLLSIFLSVITLIIFTLTVVAAVV